MERIILRTMICLGILLFTVPSIASDVFPHLEGRSFEGTVRAKGILGLMSVKGTLSFLNGNLVWEARGEKDVGRYQVEVKDNELYFTAFLTIENDETVEWSGIFDGHSLHRVEAVWTRVEGDFVHDMLLPEQVILVFTSDNN